MFILLRLLIERAQDGSLEQELDAEHVHRMRMALIGVTSATEWIAEATGHQPLTGDLRDALAFFVQNGAYNRKGQPMGELARAQELYERVFHAKSQTTSSSYCPLDEWMQEDYTFDITQQMSFGFALSAMTSTWATSDEAGTKSYVLPEHLQDLFVKFGWEAHDRAALELLSADRQWFRSEFDRLGDSPSSIAWDIRPFMQRPFLRLANGGLALLSPRALISWLSDGFHYRLLDAAQRRNKDNRRKTSRAYSSFAGDLFETYCLELASETYPSPRPVGAGRVYGEQPYGKKGDAKTSDVAIHLGTDLVLFEMSVSRPRADQLVIADPKGVAADVDRMIAKKVKQLDGCIAALISGTATIPADDEGVVMSEIERIWPVVVTAGHLAQNELTWEWIRNETARFLQQPKVQRLTILDIEDYEALMGLIQHGRSLTEILEAKTTDPYSQLELAVWAGDDPKRVDGATRPAMVESAFSRAVDRATELVDFSKGLPPASQDEQT